MHEVYQYKIILISPISINPAMLERQLNDLGLEGWYVLNSQPDYLLLERVQEVVEVSEADDSRD